MGFPNVPPSVASGPAAVVQGSTGDRMARKVAARDARKVKSAGLFARHLCACPGTVPRQRKW